MYRKLANQEFVCAIGHIFGMSFYMPLAFTGIEHLTNKKIQRQLKQHPKTEKVALKVTKSSIILKL